MKTLKRIITLVLALCLMLCAVGCGDEKYDAYDNFEPAGVYVIDYIYGSQYDIDIADAEYAQKMLKAFKELDINTTLEGEMGTAYLYLRFYDEDQSTLLIFTIYENGSCCLGEDYEDFYTVTGGRQAYIDLCDLYTAYSEE